MCAVLLGGWNSTYYLRACLILTTSGPVGDLGGVTPMLLWWRPGGTLMNWLYVWWWKRQAHSSLHAEVTVTNISSDTDVGYPYSVYIGRPQRVKSGSWLIKKEGLSLQRGLVDAYGVGSWTSMVARHYASCYNYNLSRSDVVCTPPCRLSDSQDILTIHLCTGQVSTYC